MATRYVLLTVLAFATSVVVTRLYLEATGYPQIGNDTFHFAHALWGGLLQIIAVLLLLIFVNRWVYDLSAMLAGVGVGLFIDEVGKFITQQNDYFFPLAAPIIYVAFLIILLIYLLVKRRQPSIDSRADMYEILRELEEVLEDDLSASEHDSMLTRLQRITNQTDRPDLAGLARHIMAFLQSESVVVIPDRPSRMSLLLDKFSKLEERMLSQKLARRVLIVLFMLSGFGSLFVLFILIGVTTGTQNLVPEVLGAIVLDEANVNSATSLNWFLIMTTLQLLSGILLFLSAIAFLLKRDSAAISVGVMALVISLVFINPLSFYFNQFSVLLNSIFAFIVLLALQRYRDRFLGATLDTA